tara:strand:+ start:90 stop:689 length:600 start_codon:yes stop_codon:yes gene_type:complete
MPHEPGHNEYKIIDTGQSYSGKVVKIGEYFYTSVSGVLEGTSRRVELSDGQSSNQDAEDMIQNQTITSTTNVNTPEDADTDVVTTFSVGDGSNFGNRTYYYPNGNIVPSGTNLHHHSVRPVGATSNFMTSHQMNDQTEDVYTERPNLSARLSSRRTVNRTMTPSQTTTATIGSSDESPTPPPGGGNMGGGTGGGTGGGY